MSEIKETCWWDQKTIERKKKQFKVLRMVKKKYIEWLLEEKNDQRSFKIYDV